MDQKDSDNALELATVRWGSGSPNTLLIHGLGDGSFVWDAFLSHFALRYSGFAVDLRGHGDSPWDSLQRYSGEAYASDVIAWVDALCPTSLVVIGHSLGAEVAIRLAAARPRVIRGLILVDGGPEVELRGAQVVRAQMAESVWCYDSIAELHSVLSERHPLAATETLQTLAERSVRATAAPAACRFMLKLDPALKYALPSPDVAVLRSALEAVSCPTLLVRGAISAVLSHRKAQETLRRVRGGHLVAVRDAGHAVALENPHGLSEAVEPFLRQLL
jgi:pimeloyl-ACP methyl ester carboxylesterase